MKSFNKEMKDLLAQMERIEKSIGAAKVNDTDPASMISTWGNAPTSFAQIESVMHEHNFGGKRAWLMFPNGYGASIINTSFSYGSEDGLWELAVLTKEGICYSTPITDDVVGSCSEDDILRLCQQIFALASNA